MTHLVTRGPSLGSQAERAWRVWQAWWARRARRAIWAWRARRVAGEAGAGGEAGAAFEAGGARRARHHRRHAADNEGSWAGQVGGLPAEQVRGRRQQVGGGRGGCRVQSLLEPGYNERGRRMRSCARGRRKTREERDAELRGEAVLLD